MKIPMYQDCECGHRGANHRDDGSCIRCECAKFVHPSRAHVGQPPRTARDRKTQAGGRPTR